MCKALKAIAVNVLGAIAALIPVAIFAGLAVALVQQYDPFN